MSTISPFVILSIPGLRTEDIDRMPTLKRLAEEGGQGAIDHTFPCVTWPSQCHLLTGVPASDHGVVANGFYWRDRREVEMWTAWNDVIERPQLWDMIKAARPDSVTASWFPMLAKGCGADIVCMPAPIHNPDGSEDLWCYTRPQDFYGELQSQLGHFPLQHFWGPLAGIQSSQWICESAVQAAQRYRPDFWYIYLPHLDYAAQKMGPNSDEAIAALAELDSVIDRLQRGLTEVWKDRKATWLAVSEYVITEVDHVCFPNRLLRDANLLTTSETESSEELIDFADSHAWALVDHQLAHVFVNDHNPQIIEQVVNLFQEVDGVADVLWGDRLQERALNHARSGDVVLIANTNSWFAYYWWQDDSAAPSFARTVDIHQKPGYDPVELFFDPATRSIPLNAELVKGSHGAPPSSDAMRGALICSAPDFIKEPVVRDTEIAGMVLRHLGIE